VVAKRAGILLLSSRSGLCQGGRRVLSYSVSGTTSCLNSGCIFDSESLLKVLTDFSLRRKHFQAANGWTRCSISSPSCCRAFLKSYSACRPSQSSAETPKKRASLSAGSALWRSSPSSLPRASAMVFWIGRNIGRWSRRPGPGRCLGDLCLGRLSVGREWNPEASGQCNRSYDPFLGRVACRWPWSKFILKPCDRGPGWVIPLLRSSSGFSIAWARAPHGTWMLFQPTIGGKVCSPW